MLQLADIIKHNGRLISHAVKRLVEDYESKKNSVTFQILTMLFEVLALIFFCFFWVLLLLLH
jgi:flagellar biogenesis protein FliO